MLALYVLCCYDPICPWRRSAELAYKVGLHKGYICIPDYWRFGSGWAKINQGIPSHFQGDHDETIKLGEGVPTSLPL